MTTSTNLSLRRGKIARLPRSIRDQLNLRLDDGHEADQILPWLNDLPEVRQLIAQRFEGVPISPQNLSAWRQGGFQEWLFHRQFLDTAAHVSENMDELMVVLDVVNPDEAALRLADQMLIQLGLRMNALLAQWNGNPPDSQMSVLLKTGQFILKLQQRIYRSQREAIELPGLRRKADREEQEELEAEIRHDIMLKKFRARRAAQAAEEAATEEEEEDSEETAAATAKANRESSPIKPAKASRKSSIPSPRDEGAGKGTPQPAPPSDSSDPVILENVNLIQSAEHTSHASHSDSPAAETPLSIRHDTSAILQHGSAERSG